VRRASLGPAPPALDLSVSDEQDREGRRRHHEPPRRQPASAECQPRDQRGGGTPGALARSSPSRRPARPRPSVKPHAVDIPPRRVAIPSWGGRRAGGGLSIRISLVSWCWRAGYPGAAVVPGPRGTSGGRPFGPSIVPCILWGGGRSRGQACKVRLAEALDAGAATSSRWSAGREDHRHVSPPARW
jgi:hypothetical protein